VVNTTFSEEPYANSAFGNIPFRSKSNQLEALVLPNYLFSGCTASVEEWVLLNLSVVY
jgi:hypothetical protein